VPVGRHWLTRDCSGWSEWVRIAVTWLNQEQPTEPVTKAEVEAALQKRGRPKKGEELKGDIVTLKRGLLAPPTQHITSIPNQLYPPEFGGQLSTPA